MKSRSIELEKPRCCPTHGTPLRNWGENAECWWCVADLVRLNGRFWPHWIPKIQSLLPLDEKRMISTMSTDEAGRYLSQRICVMATAQGIRPSTFVAQYTGGPLLPQPTN